MLNGQIHASLAENEDDQIDFDDHNYGNDDINNRPQFNQHAFNQDDNDDDEEEIMKKIIEESIKSNLIEEEKRKTESKNEDQ